MAARGELVRVKNEAFSRRGLGDRIFLAACAGNSFGRLRCARSCPSAPVRKNPIPTRPDSVDKKTDFIIWIYIFAVTADML